MYQFVKKIVNITCINFFLILLGISRVTLFYFLLLFFLFMLQTSYQSQPIRYDWYEARFFSCYDIIFLW